MRAEQLQGASDAAGSTTALLGIGLEFWEQGLTQIPVSKALESQCLVNRIIGNLKSPKSQKSRSGKLSFISCAAPRDIQKLDSDPPLPYQKKIERSRMKAPIQSSTIGMKGLTFKASCDSSVAIAPPK
jgi:hypothetical protein